MDKERKILHVDINHCFAQIIEMMYPQLKEVPMAVGGSEESRSGIILARNLEAKKFGVTTAETLREAYEKCPNLVIVPPSYAHFVYYSEKVKDIYREYTDKVESFGIDEAWIDLTNSETLFGDAVDIARLIQQRVLDEVGLTVSCGLSYNKVFAKLGSDMIKPSGFVVITKENFHSVVWPLPVEDLLYVGAATKAKLNALSIFTIGDLANQTSKYMKSMLGKNGEMIWYFANGYDVTEVMLNGSSDPVKSIGNSITTVEDIRNIEDAKIVFQVLAESVSSRLRDANLMGGVIAISLRDNQLKSITRQRKLEHRTNLSTEIMETVLELVRENYYFHLPLRSIGIKMSKLSIDDGVFQLNLFVDEKEREKQKRLEQCIDIIRGKYGFEKVQRLSVHINRNLTDFDPKGEHTIFPVSWF